MNVRFLEPARDEFAAAVDFYEQQAAGLGNEFIDEVEHSVELLRETPQIGAPFVDGTACCCAGSHTTSSTLSSLTQFSSSPSPTSGESPAIGSSANSLETDRAARTDAPVPHVEPLRAEGAPRSVP